jgi:hypothetical protein
MRKGGGRTWSATVTVVGLQFRWKADGRETLARNVPIPVLLEREPANEHDENAVKVIIAQNYSLKALRGIHLGYLRREVAAMIAPKLDEGSIEPVVLRVTAVDPKPGEAALEMTFRDVKLKTTAVKKGRKQAK